MEPTEAQIKKYAKELKLPTFSHYDEVLQHLGTGATYTDLIIAMMSKESNARKDGRVARRIKAAGFPYIKTLAEFDMKYLNKSVSPAFLNELATCQFIRDRKNVIMIGNPGRGKTHLAIALGVKACHESMRVIYRNAANLATELTEAQDEHRLGKLQKTIASADLLILDDIGYVSFNKAQSELLFKAISSRSELGSTIITTNVPFSKWNELFESNALVGALIDRITYKAYVLDMNGDSYRLQQSKLEAAEKANTTNTGSTESK